MTEKYEVVIGLEVHLQLNTRSKVFCGCGTKFGAPPNSQTCPVCLGFPGALPVLNRQAMTLAIKTALALDCSVSGFTKFDRKHYYYPDLPKNFQISQYDRPFSHDGRLSIDADGARHTIRIKRVHLEEDAGKLIHDEIADSSLVDYNRAGTPLLEIVTEPDIFSPQQAYEYLTKLKSILEYLEVSDCNMEEGSLRCDANISIRPKGESRLGTKTELKNMNSFKAVKAALEYETGRQAGLLGSGATIKQETRLWDSQREITTSMRSKEEAHDYRYFPEPDLMPFVADKEMIEEIRKSIPEMPDAKRERFKGDYNLSDYDADTITRDRRLSCFFEDAVSACDDPKQAANWILGDISKELNDRGISIDKSPVTPRGLADIIVMIKKGTISGKIAKDVLRQAMDSGKSPEEIVKEKGLVQISDESALEKAVDKAIASNKKSAEDYRSGKESALMFLMGQVMKETKGKANPKLVNEILKRKLG
ncbi:MAG: Asp-tRNA(Asn)/Glu-tRNA(Gln) amidotransferase subunit GatB [Candidatus Omnitrophota bacterium]